MTVLEKPLGIRRETLAAGARSEIERRILAGDIRAGEKLNEVALATDLMVSRGTVREAIRSLADSGLIALIPNRGAFVRSPTVAEISNLYDLRGAVFAMACGAAARAAGADPKAAFVPALRENLNAMRAAFTQDDRSSYYELNIVFHDMILAAADNPKAKAVYDGLVKEMHLFRRRGLSVAMNIAQSIEEHGAIVAAVAAGDVDGARAAGQKHIDSGLSRFMRTLSGENDDNTSGGNT